MIQFSISYPSAVPDTCVVNFLTSQLLDQSQISSAESFANASIVSASSVPSQIMRSRCVALSYLLGRPRPRRLNESRDSGYGLGVRRFERELLREESDAVTGGFGAECVRRVIDLELLRFAHDLEVLSGQLAIQK